MTAPRAFLVAVLLAGLVSWAAVAAQDAPALPPLEQCQGEVLQLKAALIEWQQRAIVAEAQLAQRELATQRQAFETRVREATKAPADAVFDWSRLRFVSKEPK